MIPAKKAAYASSSNGKLTANEFRELMVAVGAKVWYELISVETVAKSWVSAGLSSALDGSENEHAKAQLPASERGVIPPYGSSTAQAGFGVVVTGVGVEVVSWPQGASVSRVEASRNPPQLHLQAPEADDAKLVFRTELEEKQEKSSKKPPKPRKKAKTSEKAADESGAEADSAKAGSEDSSSGEDSEEEHTPRRLTRGIRISKRGQEQARNRDVY